MTVYLSIGSNIEPEKNIPACVRSLREVFRVLKVSSVYETEPVGPAGPGKFWNLAAAVETPLSGEALQKKIRALEDALGRRRDKADKFAPRTIDVDVVGATGWEDMDFIAVPLAEIAPELRTVGTARRPKELGTLRKILPPPS